MGIDYRYNAGYGFLLSLKEYALPAMWDDRDLWFSGDIDNEIKGSGLTAVLGGDMMSGEELWGFVAKETMVSMNKYSNDTLLYMRDINPATIGNVFDMRMRVKIPKARIGWMMWSDIS